jgi:hypothetical protein
MSKEKIEIDFHGKKISLLEAKLYICGLNLGITKPKLIEEEEHDYLIWKYILNGRNERAKMQVGEEIYKKLEKEDYLIDTMKAKIREGKRKYCEEHGHKEKKGSAYTQSGIEGVTHAQCSRCEVSYEKKSSFNPFG